MKTKLLFIILLFQQIITAQFQIKTFSGGNIFDIAELGVIVNEEKGKLKVDVLLPKEQRKKEYADVDLQQGDELLMVNGSKVKSAKDCKEIYDKLKIGEEFKMGINRDGNKFITRFKKADPKDLPQRKIVIKEDGDSAKDIFAFPALGLILKTEKGKLVVEDVIDEIKTAISGKDIKTGDVITGLNGEAIKSGQSFSRKYDDIKVGEKLSIEYSRAGRKFSASIIKPEPKGKVVIRK